MTVETSERYWRHPSGAVGVEITSVGSSESGEVRTVSGVMPDGCEPITKATYDAEVAAAAAAVAVDHRVGAHGASSAVPPPMIGA